MKRIDYTGWAIVIALAAFVGGCWWYSISKCSHKRCPTGDPMLVKVYGAYQCVCIERPKP